MPSLNKVILIGHLGKDPEIRSMKNNKEVASFSFATSEHWKNKNTGEKSTHTEWHNIVIFNSGIIEIARQYLHKGDNVYIEGSLKTRKWTDDKERDHYVTEVILQGYNCQIKILKNSNNKVVEQDPIKKIEQQHKKNMEKIADEYESLIDDEIPF